MTSPLLDLTAVSKGYGGLRPLRVERLTLFEADRVAISGFDRPMAEVFVNLVTGAALPDSGAVTVFGRRTSDIADSTEWLAFVDRIGIMSERAVLLEGMTAVQNLALPFTVEIEPPGGESLRRAEELAREVGLAEESWQQPIAELDGLSRAFLRLGRAIALEPALVLLEHPTVAVDPKNVMEFDARLAIVAARRQMAVVVMTADEPFVERFSGRTLRLHPATGQLTERLHRRWFRRRSG